MNVWEIFTHCIYLKKLKQLIKKNNEIDCVNNMVNISALFWMCSEKNIKISESVKF